MLKTTRSLDKPVPSRNNGSKSAFNRNDNSRLVFGRNNSNSNANRFSVDRNYVKHTKKSEKLFKSEKLSQSGKLKSKKMSKF